MRYGWVAVALGGAIGSVARHAINVFVAHRSGQAGPLATVVVNVAGCAVIGLLAGLLAGGRLSMGTNARLFIFVGVLGGFTTFSTFGLDTFTLVREGRHAAALWNVGLQVVMGLAAVAAGYFAGLKS